MDFFFVNSLIFFHSKSYKLIFILAQYCTSASLKTVNTVLTIIQNKYKGGSLEIEDYNKDNKFDKVSLKDFLQPALLHIN